MGSNFGNPLFKYANLLTGFKGLLYGYDSVSS